MAGVSHDAAGRRAGSVGMGTQAALIAGLRWRLLRNSLRMGRARWELAAQIVLGAAASVVAVATGVGLGMGAYLLMSRGQPEKLAVMLLVVFLGWQLLPLLVAVSGIEFDFRNLLRFPLRFSTFFLLSVLYGLFEPAGVAALLWLGCIGGGIYLARPDLLSATAVALVTLAGVSLLFNRILFSWLERVFEERRKREAFFLVFLLGLLSIQLFVALGERWGKELDLILEPVRPLADVLPPGAASRAIASGARGEAQGVAEHIVLLGAYGLGCAVLLRRRLRAQYLGEDAGESRVAGLGSQQRAVLFGWKLPGFPGPVTAMVEKEARYVVRNGPMVLTMLVPLFFIVFFAIVKGGPEEEIEFLARAPEMMFPSAVAYALLVLAPLAYNCFAFDGRGIQALMLAPVRFRDVLVGMNLVHGAMIFFEGVVIWVLLGLLVNPPGGRIVAATFSGLLFATLVHLTAGNVVSLYFPRRFDFGKFRQRQSGAGALIGLGVQIVVLGMAALVLLAARWMESLWWGVGIFLGLSAAAWQVYLLGLEHCGRLAEERREVLTTELCRG